MKNLFLKICWIVRWRIDLADNVVVICVVENNFDHPKVSRKSITQALDGGISVCIIPGGQSEVIESSSRERDITLVIQHKGFIRLAIRTGATLLPIFCFGDTKLMDNVNMKKMQRRSKSIIGFPFPFVPYGSFLQQSPSVKLAVIKLHMHLCCSDHEK